MTEHIKAIPRLHSELDSSHLIVHGENDHAIAAGFVMINIADTFISSDRNSDRDPSKFIANYHRQPHCTMEVLNSLGNLNRRTRPGEVGYDALCAIVVDCKNDGSPIQLHKLAPAPQPGSTYHYADFISRLRNFYETRFASI